LLDKVFRFIQQTLNKRDFLREMADHKFQIYADGFDSDIFYQRN
jgi:hypothetical protein